MNIAKQDWHWQFNDSVNRLEVCSSESTCYQTNLRKSQLSGDALRKQSLAIDDLAFLHATYESMVEQCGKNDETALLLAISAASARKFFKPALPQSWFFLPSSAVLTISEQMLIELDTPIESGIFLTIETNETTSLLMSINDELALTEHKTLAAGHIIRVMNDRIARYASNSAIESSRKLLTA
ncbi:cell division protein ZapC [Neiella marina]|uniref:Cell division protein ZapC n=1 Tax=Neiella holothuriorum TaxID=2870530 RepID=A0ABS7ED57_9GAMM|nr:cell division protein ZapC domain-containing protein [Neiella holothuriorum]MBW8190281.1 cell division protein ZapC [Neiella holothuriorum]